MTGVLASDIARYKSHPAQVQLIAAVKALYSHPAFAGVIWYRLSRYLWLKKRNPLFLFLLLLTRVLYPLIRIYSGLEIAPSVEIGPGLWVGHFGPIVLNPLTKAGCNLTLLHGVTIGAGTGGEPILGDNISIGVGATLIGSVQVGHNVIIGAGAVVTKNIPDDSVAVGIPAQARPRQLNEN